MMRREPILLQGQSDFMVVDGMFDVSCNDVPGYEFLKTEAECKEAMEYLYDNSIISLNDNIDETGQSLNSRWSVFSNTSARPLGCYYYPAGKKVIHPSNMCESGSCVGNQIAHDDADGKVKQAAKSKLNRKQICVLSSYQFGQGLQPLTQPETQPETQPAATQPAATQPAATQPAETQPAETQPAPTQPAPTQPAATQPASQEKIVIDTVAPTIVPFCQWNRGTIQGEKIITEKNVYLCPEGTTIYCPDEYSVDDEKFTTTCVWEKDTAAPFDQPPEPKCQPNEARTVYISECQPTDITTEKCKDDIPCQMDGKNCFCPENVEKIEVTCNATEESINNVSGTLDCGEYGTEYQLTCPDGYLLNKTTQLCEKIALQSL